LALSVAVGVSAVAPLKNVTWPLGATAGEPDAPLGVTTAVSTTGALAEAVVGGRVSVVVVAVVVPVPVRLMVWVAPAVPVELSVIVIVAVAAPMAFGVNTTAILQLCPG
jgi:hypothetical protein